MRVYNSVIFDLGGVIEKINPLAVAQEFRKLGIKNAESIFTQFKQSAVCTSFELGIATKEDFVRYIKSMCPIKVSDHLIESIWCANQQGVSQQTVKILEWLKQIGIRLFILSNTNPIHAAKIEEVFFKTFAKDFRSIFEAVYYSFEIHARKPNIEAYSYLLNHSKLRPEECIYIDDLAVNLDVPKEMGMHCMHHSTNDEVENIALLNEILGVVTKE